MSAKKQTALISVYNKEGIVEFAKGLDELGWDIVASGGTAKKIAESGIKVTDVAEWVGGDPILGHRVVTLSREVHSGLLADRDDPDHIKEMEAEGINFIDLVCVDMYPLEAEIAKEGSTKKSVMEQTDIGGPGMLRSAAKGRRITLSSADQRQQVLQWLKDGRPEEAEFVERLAAKAEFEAARYIMTNALYLSDGDAVGSIESLHTYLKYGENGQQKPAAFYSDGTGAEDPLSIANFKHVKGPDFGAINVTDMDRLLQTVTHIAAGFDKNFGGSVPAIAVGVKHGNACGAAVSDNMQDAVKRMLEGDRRAIFGGVIMINGPVTREVATVLMKHAVEGGGNRMLAAVIGSEVGPEALELFKSKRMHVFTNPALSNLNEDSLSKFSVRRQVRGGVVVQPSYSFVQNFAHEDVEITGELNEQAKKDMILAWAIGSTSNSNTITIVKDGMLLGNGVGQQDRVGAAQLAISRTQIEGHDIKGAVAYGDSFFPFEDGPMILVDAGISAILATRGSIRDEEVKTALQSKGVTFVTVPDSTGRGFFGH